MGSLSCFGFLDRNFCYKSVATEIPHDAGLGKFIPAGDQTSTACHSTRSKQYALNHVTTALTAFSSLLYPKYTTAMNCRCVKTHCSCRLFFCHFFRRWTLWNINKTPMWFSICVFLHEPNVTFNSEAHGKARDFHMLHHSVTYQYANRSLSEGNCITKKNVLKHTVYFHNFTQLDRR